MVHEIGPSTRKRIDGREIVVSVSGGKDSAAMSLFLHEQGIPHRRMFMDTGWEHPDTLEYIRGPLSKAIGPIDEVKAPRTLEELIRHKGVFPSRLTRWCTVELKVKVSAVYMKALKESGLDPISAVGIRAGESRARSILREWEGCTIGDWDIWRPIIAWSEQDVIEIHQRHGLTPNPLYFRGARRVGCWPCIHASKAEIRLVSETDPQRIALIEELESYVRERYEARHEGELTDESYRPTFFKEGNIRQMEEWSYTSWGGQQIDMGFDEPGCVRWGMCEHETPGDRGVQP